MSSKKWFCMFVSTIMLMAIALIGLNYITDPFGVFQDKFYNWYSYNFTNNPRVSKIAYLDKNHDKYDSYIIGCSLTSSFPVEDLNKYYNAKFFNMIMYGADMYDIKSEAEYVLEHYEVKNLIINTGISDAIKYNYEIDPLTYSIHAKTDGSSLLSFYTKYLFASPQYGINKIRSVGKDTYLPKAFDVFNADTGAYNKTARDVESIGNLDEYLNKYPDFETPSGININFFAEDEFYRDIREIKQLCEEKGATFTLIVSPLHEKALAEYDPEDLARIWKNLSEITDFWDFSKSSISFDPRYFYDSDHFRNALGTMALAKMFDNKDVYIPEDFGSYVTASNVLQENKKFSLPAQKTELEKQIPILMYHHIGDENDNTMVISPENFEAQIRALKEQGYTSISSNELIAYVEHGTELPKKPILITFDDGYLSNYEMAYPILKKYNTKATIFVIGSSVGKENYKDTKHPIYPHFQYAQAKEMVDSNLISIQSHSYDLHQYASYENGQARENAIMHPGENEQDYIEFFCEDFQKSKLEIEQGVHKEVNNFSYPNGVSDTLSNALLKKMGVKVTFTTTMKTNTIIKGLPQSLIDLGRYTISNEISAKELLELINVH